MFPEVHKHSFIALIRFCNRKNFRATKKYIEDTWDKSAIYKMMHITNTADFDGLIYWLIEGPDFETKLAIINNNFNQFKHYEN